MAKNYTSEITQFIKKYKDENPSTESRQKEGRHIFWDKNVDQELHDGFNASYVPQKPYVYYQVD